MFKRVIGLVILSALVVIFAAGNQRAKADGETLSVFVDCIEDGHIWFGYESSADGHDEMIGYIDDGPGIYFDHVTAGVHHRAAEAVLDQDEEGVLFFVGAWFGDEYAYSAAWVTHETTAGSCTAEPGGGDLATITIWDVEGSLFRWEIRDANGNWNVITVAVTPLEYADGRTFTRLVLGTDNPNHNAADYRAFAVG